MTDDTTIQIEVENDITVVTFGPSLKHLDDTAVIECQDLLLEAARNASPPHVLFDLTNVHLFGSTFIEVIFRVWHRLNAETDGRFALCSAAKTWSITLSPGTGRRTRPTRNGTPAASCSAMSSASSSIETPAFTRRTLDWLSTSLLKGMSREDDRVIL